MDIGAWDWTSEAFADALYPSDLPEEWRIGFYSGLFRCVVLPAALWCEASAEDWEEWLDEVPENFGFYLEQGEAEAAEVAAAAAKLGDLLHGVLLAAPLDVAATEDALLALPEVLKLWPVALSEKEPLGQVGARVWGPQAFSAAAVHPAAEFQGEIMDNAQSLSQTSAQDALQGYACLGLCCLPALDGSVEWSPLRLRQMLEAASAWRVCAMAVMPGAEALTVMRQLETLAGLMDL
jgi:hypothetical protein